MSQLIKISIILVSVFLFGGFIGFIVSDTYEKISSGKFHDEWFINLKKNNFIDKETNKKIPTETIRLLEIQKDSMIKQLIKYPNLYYAKSKFPLEIS